MNIDVDHEANIASITHWSEDQPQVRAALLTSTLAVPGAYVDVFSDYDVILVVTDVHTFYADRFWLEDFGPVLAVYTDPLEPQDGFLKFDCVTQYRSGLKIDFTLWPVDLMRKIAADQQLMPELDAGYRILMDKDHLTSGIQPPTYKAYIPHPPSEAAYREAIENFFLTSIYVAKYLWRDDVMAARHVLDAYMTQESLRPMLEWHFEIARGWTVKPGLYGRGIKKWLRPDLHADLLSTYTRADPDENWAALERTIALMRKTALEVGRHFGYIYPESVEQGALALIQRIRDTQH